MKITMSSTFRCAGTLLVAGALALAGCSGSDGKDGANGTNGTNGASTGTLMGKVTIASTTPALPVVGATVAISPAVQGVTITTNATGDYTAALPIGAYTLTFTAPNFTSQTKSVSILAAQTTTQNVALAATAKVVVAVTTNATSTTAPGSTLNVSAVVTPLDGSTVSGVTWSAVGPAVTFGSTTATSTTATLANAAAFKANLFTVLNESPVAGETLQATLQDRFKVQAIAPFDLEEGGKVTLKVTATTSSGTYTGYTDVEAALPYVPQAGIAQVPVGVRVLVHGKALGTWNYTLTPPATSTAALDDATSQNPSFVPDVSGAYTLTESGSGGTLTINAGTWKGVIDATQTLAALDATTGLGNPVGVGDCTVCHSSGSSAPDNFTPWSKSGHASILAQNVNAGGHYQESCFTCHTVGYNKNASNNGMDEQSDFADMMALVFTVDGKFPAPSTGNWAKVLSKPASARMTNIQCENCHGPQVVSGQSSHSSAAVVAARVSFEAGVCGVCHGEPTHHGRNQEWAISGHGNVQLALDEGFDTTGAIRTSCAGCHTGQGAIQFFAQLQGGNASRSLTAASITNLSGMTADTVQPQTCVVCHDPHNPGTKSSLGTDAQPRITGSTSLLPGGFAAYGVGKGAVCITCHNSRNGEKTSGSGVVGLHEDGDSLWGTPPTYGAPHAACQGDVLMGRNAYFVQGIRGAHSGITNTCVQCHMDMVAPPPELGTASQSNHMFKANLTICSRCHGSYDGAGVQASVAGELGALKAEIERILMLYAPAGATSALLTTSHGSPAVSYDGGTTVVTVSATVPFASNPTNAPILSKILWNYNLINGDLSLGVHNPSFAHQVVWASTVQAKSITTVQ